MEAIAKKTREKLLRTIIIDDEEHQRKSLERLIQLYCPDLKVVCLAEGVKSGLEAIKQHKPDLVLLDVRMTDGLGFDLLDQLKPLDFKVIFISAYEQYAKKASAYSSFSYLLKPIDPDELIQVVESAGEL